MKTIVEYANLEDNEKHLKGDGYEIGELSAKAWHVLCSRKGWRLQTEQLCGRFDGVQTFIDFLNENGSKFGSRKPESDDSSHSKERRSSWVKHATYEAAYEAITNKPETFRHFTEADIRIKEWASNGNDIDYDIMGDFVDVGRALAGEPECFGTMHNGLVTKRFANIVVNGNHACRVNQTWIDKKAQRATRLVDFLEANNVRCKITIVFSNDNSHLELVVKQYNDRLDLNDVSVALSADFFRRFGFYFSEHSKRHTSSYGRAEDLVLGAIKDDDADVDILINSNDGRFYVDAIDSDFDRVENKMATNGVERGDEYAILA